MAKLFNNRKKILLRLAIVVLFAMFIANLQIGLTSVSAQVFPITVNFGHLDFGQVFPGEELYKDFTVFYDGEEETVPYRIIQKIKPRPDAAVPDGYTGLISQYCQENPADFTLCYRNLCPFISKISQEEEGDLEAGATVSPSDPTDVWYVKLDVPAVIGQVAQDHGGGIVNESGEYGCDIAIDIVEPTGGSVEFSAASSNGGGNGSGSGISALGSNGAAKTSSPLTLGEAGAPNLTVSKITNTEFANPGQTSVAYEIIVANNGNLAAYNVSVTDTLPDGFYYSGTTERAKIFALGDLAPGEIKKITYTADIGGDVLPGRYQNTILVSADNHDPVSAASDLDVRGIEVAGIELVPSGFRLSELLFLIYLIAVFYAVSAGLRLGQKSLEKPSC